MIFHCDSTFTVWNTLTSLNLQMTKYVEKKSSRDESEQACYMVQGNDSLEVNSDTRDGNLTRTRGDPTRPDPTRMGRVF